MRSSVSKKDVGAADTFKEAANAVAQTEREIKKAVDSVCAQVESEYQSAFRNHEQIQEDLKKQKAESLDLDRYALQYTKLERDLKLNESILQNITSYLIFILITRLPS